MQIRTTKNDENFWRNESNSGDSPHLRGQIVVFLLTGFWWATKTQNGQVARERALLAAMNSTRKAAVLTGVNDRIVRAQRYRSVYDKITPY
jgi:hypothetical protein